MKRISVLAATCLIVLAQIAFAQPNPDLISANTGAGTERPKIDPNGPIHEQFLTFDDNSGVGNAGTYNPSDNLGFDIFLTFSGYNSPGLDVWFETTASAAPHIFLTGYTLGSTFNDPLNLPPATFPMGFTVLQTNGLYTTPNPSDFGGTTKPFSVVGPGTYFVGRLSISLSGLAPGIYTLQSAATLPHASQVTSFDGTNFVDNPLPNTAYTITVVPEPSTFALLALATFGGGAWLCRRAPSKGFRLQAANNSTRCGNHPQAIEHNRFFFVR